MGLLLSAQVAEQAETLPGYAELLNAFRPVCSAQTHAAANRSA
jgi:hypothetical protein